MMLWLNKGQIDEARREGRALELHGDNSYREPVLFIRKPDGSLYIYIDGGEGGDSEMGFYGIDADRTLDANETKQLREFLRR